MKVSIPDRYAKNQKSNGGYWGIKNVSIPDRYAKNTDWMGTWDPWGTGFNS